MKKDKILNLLFRIGQALCFFYILGLAGASDTTAVPFGELSLKVMCAAAVFVFLSICKRKGEAVG